jgi:hypothetical protein
VDADKDCLHKQMHVLGCMNVMEHTFGVLVVRLLEILHNTLLADELFDLALGLDVEGVFVEEGNLVLALALGVLDCSLAHDKRLSPAVGVVDGGGKVGVALTQLGLCLGVHKELLSHTLWIRLSRGRRPSGLWTLHLRAVLANDDGQHLTIPYSGILERLCLVGHGLAVEVDAL